MAELRDYVEWHRAYDDPASGFAELDHATRDSGSRPALGAVRYAGPATPLVSGERLFTFVR